MKNCTKCGQPIVDPLEKHKNYLKDKKHLLLSSRNNTDKFRKYLLEKNGCYPVSDPYFEFLIGVEQLQFYLMRELNKDLKKHGIPLCSGTQIPFNPCEELKECQICEFKEG